MTSLGHALLNLVALYTAPVLASVDTLPGQSDLVFLYHVTDSITCNYGGAA